MKRAHIVQLIGFCLLIVQYFTVQAQDINVLFKEASNFERVQKENEALEKYKLVLALELPDEKNSQRPKDIKLLFHP